MATQTVVISEIQPAEGRKFLSKHRDVQLPLPNFDEKEHNASEFVPFTPIQQALQSRATHNQSTETLGPPKAVKFRIYLSRMENSAIPENGVELSIEAGKTADTRKLMFYLAKSYGIEYQAFSEMFAIWMISPLLEVQLKPYHRPYECRQGWETLLDRFADGNSGQSFAMDEPILMLRRNASLTCQREFELLEENPSCAHFLISDAREMLLLGRLQFLSLNTTIYVTASLFCLQYGNFDEQTHDVAFIRSHIEEILPEKTCEMIAAKTIFGKALNKKTAQEETLLQDWKQFSKVENGRKEREFLMKLTQESSCYGAAWFSAQIEKKTSRASLRNFGQSFAEIHVNIGINDRFLTIVDPNSSETLLVQRIDEMTWQLEPGKEDEKPFLILNLSCDEQIKETTLFLMVTGNQTVLIDALLRSVTGRRLERAISDSSSSSDSSTSSTKHAMLIQSNVEASSNRKLCLAKFQDGKCTEVAGSFKAFYSHGQKL